VIHVLLYMTGMTLCGALYEISEVRRKGMLHIQKCRFCFSLARVRRFNLSSRAAALCRRSVSRLPSCRLGLFPFFFVIFLVTLLKRLLTILFLVA
jgi:hypothetical protein